MSSSSSSPEATPNRDVRSNTTLPDGSSAIAPDYVGLVRFLIEPFLSHPEALRLDCERSHQRIFVRVAVDDRDRGRACGRGGRNLDAIRHVLSACAKVAGEIAHLDIFGGVPEATTHDRRETPHPKPGHRVPPPKPILRRDRPTEP